MKNLHNFYKKKMFPPTSILRNESCHCGSGLRYKHCHGKLISDINSIPAIESTDDEDSHLLKLLEISNQLSAEIQEALNSEFKNGSFRFTVTKAMVDVTLEHINSQRLLIAAGHDVTALALVRLQYEALVRSIWLHHCATEQWLTSFRQPLTQGQLEEPIKGPPVDSMLISIDSHAPEFVGKMLREYKDASWAPMNSYVHGGVRAIGQSMHETSPQQLINVLRNANGIALMAANVFILARSNPLLLGWITALQLKYKQILP